MSAIHYAIQFGNKKSGKAPYGQKDAYPLAMAELADGYRTYSGMGDRKGQTVMDTSYFALFDKTHSGFDQDMLAEIEAYLNNLLKTKMDPDTIKILELTTSDDSANYKINRSVEHPKGLIGMAKDNNFFTIVSDTATVSSIPAGGTDATYQTALDFVNRRINGK